MIRIVSSNATTSSKNVVEVERNAREDNIRWLERTMPPGDDQCRILLVGGRSPSAFRLRLAQSHVRHDLVPSYWSHVALVGALAKEFSATPVFEISLEPRGGLGFPTPNNGVQEATVAQYRDPKAFPNIAVLSVPVPLEDALTALERFKKQRTVLDGVDLILHWLGYVWGVARSVNPLSDGLGIPSAAMIEIVIGACGFDLTPGLESRSSCPEAIWQAAKWWHEYYEDQKKLGLAGSYFAPHNIQ